MTIIVGYIDGNVIVMGCDSAATDEDNDLRIRLGCAKMWRMHDFIVGFSGNYSELNWFKHVFQWPYRDKKKESIENWLLNKVLVQINLQFEKTLRKDPSWVLLFGFARPGRLIVLSQNGDLCECSDNFACIGNAESIAMGCLKTLENETNLYSWEKVQKTLEICEMYNNAVRKPMHIEILLKKY
jgi:ATP-dependent protease HslVU (ClpYQ) peptidase subunit